MAKRDYLSQSELMILLAVMRLGHEAYGVPIMREIGERTGRDVAAGVVYSSLQRLEDHGLVSSEVGAATAERGGRAKTYFRVTAKGLKQVRETRQALQHLWDGIPQLKGSSA